MMVYGEESAAEFLRQWLADKSVITLVTGRTSFSKCGAEDFLMPYLSGKKVVRLATVGENARAEDVEEKLLQIPAHVDAFIAVGGGTVIDTAKLLRNGFPSGIHDGVPYLAIPTTAGTGAETTRFAVYYDHGKKCSADDVRYLPTDVILMPEFTETQSEYQRASTEFDAYAQAVESLWAKGATDESRVYAQKALNLMSSGQQMLGSYWAGKAIDISRTTAAHALSYFMTSHYGVPHGHAVYMMFPYVCRANGHEEHIKEVPELCSLRTFAEKKGLRWTALVSDLVANVNPQRLSNNPGPISIETFEPIY